MSWKLNPTFYRESVHLKLHLQTNLGNSISKTKLLIENIFFAGSYIPKVVVHISACCGATKLFMQAGDKECWVESPEKKSAPHLSWRSFLDRYRVTRLIFMSFSGARLRHANAHCLEDKCICLQHHMFSKIANKQIFSQVKITPGITFTWYKWNLRYNETMCLTLTCFLLYDNCTEYRHICVI